PETDAHPVPDELERRRGSGFHGGICHRCLAIRAPSQRRKPPRIILRYPMDAMLLPARRSRPPGHPPPTGFDHPPARSGDPRVRVLRADHEAKAPAASAGAPARRTAVRRAHRPGCRESPAGGETRSRQPRPAARWPGDRALGTCLAGARDAAPQAMTGVRRDRADGFLIGIETERVETEVLAPEACLERRLERARLRAQLRRARRFADRVEDLRHAHPRIEDVTLQLA